MNQKSAIITQSNYIPWKGYFDSIALADIFVVYDDMQYTKRDWRNRNLIKSAQGPKWLSIPVEVKGKYFQKIKDTKISDANWNVNHWNQLKQNYKEAAQFREMSGWVESLYRECNAKYLSEINIYFISAISEFLGIKTDIRLSSEFDLHEEKTQRLLNICLDVGAKHYYSGPAARDYMDESKFEREGIEVHYLDYAGYPEYKQLFPPFSHKTSILDLIFNQGTNSINYLKHTNK